MLLAQVIVIYRICGLLYPEFEPGVAIDLRQHCFEQRKQFFGFLIGAAGVSILRHLVLNRALPNPLNLTFHMIWIGTAAIAIFTPNEWYHKAFAVFSAAAFVDYIIKMFVKLQ